MSYFANQPGYQTANLHAGIDPATGKPFYLAGYDAQMQPVFSWNPVYNAAEYGGGVVDRSSGHFADAMASGGQFGQLGQFVSNAQGSMYQTQAPNQLAGGQPTLQQTGSYQPNISGGGTGGGNVNSALGGVPAQGGAQGPAPVSPQQNQLSQQPPQQRASQAQSPFFRPENNNGFNMFNQSGPNTGGLSNFAAYGPQRGQYNRVPWQSRLGGGGGAAFDRPGQSASRLF